MRVPTFPAFKTLPLIQPQGRILVGGGNAVWSTNLAEWQMLGAYETLVAQRRCRLWLVDVERVAHSGNVRGNLP